jgi:hypothetical protein
MCYPDKLLKGIPRNCITQEGFPSSEIFHFKRENSPEREDGFIENSINWNDDENALKFTLSQKKKDGSIQFESGVAVILKNELDRLKKLPLFKPFFDYERNSLLDNPYHGNLLLREEISKPTMKAIAGTLATHVEEIITDSLSQKI